jgi:hypothetical protein
MSIILKIYTHHIVKMHEGIFKEGRAIKRLTGHCSRLAVKTEGLAADGSTQRLTAHGSQLTGKIKRLAAFNKGSRVTGHGS